MSLENLQSSYSVQNLWEKAIINKHRDIIDDILKRYDGYKTHLENNNPELLEVLKQKAPFIFEYNPRVSEDIGTSKNPQDLRKYAERLAKAPRGRKFPQPNALSSQGGSISTAPAQSNQAGSNRFTTAAGDALALSNPKRTKISGVKQEQNGLTL